MAEANKTPTKGQAENTRTNGSAENTRTNGSAETTAKKSDAKVADKKSVKKPTIFSAIALFLRQIVDEMKKVTAPTKDELVEYSIVVLVFVLVIMLFITGIDFLIGKGIMALFAK